MDKWKSLYHTWYLSKLLSDRSFIGNIITQNCVNWKNGKYAPKQHECFKIPKINTNSNSIRKCLHSIWKVYTMYVCNVCKFYITRNVQKIAENDSVHRFHASNMVWTVTKSLGKLLSSFWCLLKIYTADKNLTQPLVAPVAPNINSALYCQMYP